MKEAKAVFVSDDGATIELNAGEGAVEVLITQRTERGELEETSLWLNAIEASAVGQALIGFGEGALVMRGEQ